MNGKQNAKHKFDTNLIKASKSQTLNIAKDEWRFICEEKRWAMYLSKDG